MKQKLISECVIGIAGGMGKATSHQLVETLSKIAPNLQIRYALAQQHGLIDADVADYIMHGMHIDHFESVVVQMIKRLTREGSTHIVLACNTAHRHEKAILEAIGGDTQFLSIIEAVRAEVIAAKLSSVFIMATSRTTMDLDLYDSLPGLIKPAWEEQLFIDSLIVKILSGEITEKDIQILVEIAHGHNTDGFLFACTDLALIKNLFQQKLSDLGIIRPVIESTEALLKFILTNANS